MNQLRKDYLLDRWVIIAKKRGKRPHDFFQISRTKRVEGVCSFCPGNEHMTPPEIDRVEEAGEWIIRCFPNKFPATMREKGLSKRNLLTKMSAYGIHEIIVETPEHDVELGDLSFEHIRKILDMYIKRLIEIKKDRKIKYVSIFKNKGEIAGASIEHSHTQIIAIPIIPPIIRAELNAIKRYKRRKNRCILCDIWKMEMKSRRKIFEDKYIAAFAPYASISPFEVWIMPKNHVPSLERLSNKEKDSLAKTLKIILNVLNKTLNYPPYNFYFHLSPDKEDMHLHLELLPRLSKWGGFELSNNIIINTMPPEMAAKHYRDEI